MGVDHLTGTTLDPAVKTLIKDPKIVARITAMKQRPHFSQACDLLPVFDNDGVVVAYERPLDRKILDQHLVAKPDLAQSIGMWMGRQAEEDRARVQWPGGGCPEEDLGRLQWNESEWEFVDITWIRKRRRRCATLGMPSRGKPRRCSSRSSVGR